MRLFNKKITFNTKYFFVIPFLIPIIFLIGDYSFDNDFWFTINQGRYVLSNGFPNFVIGTVHEGLSFIYQSYGTGIIFYLIYHYLGKIGVTIFIILLIETIIFIFYKLCLLISNNNKISLIITSIFSLLSYTYTTTRPHMFTILNLLLIIYLLELFIKTKKTKYLIPIPIIGILEANMYAIYFIPLLIIISPYLINSFKFKYKFIQSDGYNKKTIIIIFIITLLAGLINPYTYKILTYGFSSYGTLISNRVVELKALNFHDLFGKLCIITILITYIFYFINKDKKVPLRYYLLLFGTTYLAFDALKSFYFFVVCSLFPIAYMYKKNNEYKSDKKVLITSFIIVIITLSLCLLTTNYKKPLGYDIANYLDSNNTIDTPKVYTSFMEGSYLEYRGYNCYIDPRAELFLKVNNKKKDIIDEYFKLQDGRLNYKEFIKEYNFDYLIIKKEYDILYYHFKNYGTDNYTKVYDKEDYEIWKKDA